MMDYNKLIQALTTNFVAVENMRVLQHFTIEDFYDFENIFILNHSAEISYLQTGKRDWINPGELLFIPNRKRVTITYGPADSMNLAHDYYLAHRWKYLQKIPLSACEPSQGSFRCLSFEARVLEGGNLFASPAIPALGIRDNKKLVTLFNNILAESASQIVGSGRVLTNCTELLVIELLRYMANNNLLPKELNMYHPYCRDIRFINIISYIRKNLDKDLSNFKLAAIAKISGDYLGQYFKLRIGIKPREYVESQRLEQAMRLLRTTSKSISEITSVVGFRDMPYFCRRFKLRLGVQPGKIRGGMR